MADVQMDSAVNRLDAALARIEAAQLRAKTQPSANAAALAALEQRHAALRQVLNDCVRELDTLLAAAEAAPQVEASQAKVGT
ncbi:hypothetical protein [Novosphingobium sp.]|uniref:hypothetical protein n=1 Tax=Novosphingobium sp. TaxID=1874826 RepID=UPI0025FA1D14|nr:hypothetical protein [Novosphingobium sp.]